jgi:dTDP-4-dehydrorhamnose reductase
MTKNGKQEVLVIGANGTLGQTFRYHYYGIEADFAVRQMTPNSSDVWFDLNEVDDEYAVEMLKAYDYVVNCAAITDVDAIEKDLDTKDNAYKVNASGARKLAQWCRDANTTLIHISTDFVFDGNSCRPYIEDDMTNPINVYGITKLNGEQYIRESGCKYFIIRTSWLYSEYGNNAFTRITKLLEDGEKLCGVDDIISSPTYARDLVYFICEIITKENNHFGVYHFTNEGVCTRYDFMYVMNQYLGAKFFDIDVVSNDKFHCSARRPYCSVLSKVKARQIMPIIPWQESLLDCITNYRALKYETNKKRE